MAYKTIIAEFKLTEKKEFVIKELQKLAELSIKEKGCIDYKFYFDDEDPSILMLYENWESDADLDAHMKSAHFKECFDKIDGMFELNVHNLTAMR